MVHGNGAPSQGGMHWVWAEERGFWSAKPAVGFYTGTCPVWCRLLPLSHYQGERQLPPLPLSSQERNVRYSHFCLNFEFFKQHLYSLLSPQFVAMGTDNNLFNRQLPFFVGDSIKKRDIWN